MSGDYSRFTDRPGRRYTGVRMQQGRVQLDADWNEEVAILKRRWETQAEDTFGPCAVPEATTSDGFKITPSGTDLQIGVGRIYVHGRVAEVFAGEVVKEGTTEHPVSYLHQPYYPQPPALAGANYVVYLDVWDREVTYIEDPDILEKALGGPDTATRIQTVWQVKFQQVAQGGSASCGATVGEPASTGTLSTQAVAPPASDDPCILSPTGGYRGIENRLYRVEIHDTGATTRFKWSRENVSVASAVTDVVVSGAESQLTVARIGRDAVLRFQIDDWVEVTDDYLELTGQSGQMARVKKVIEATRTLVLDGVVSGFATTSDEHKERHTRVRRWNQRNASGLLAVAPGAWIALEDGVEVRFSAGTYHAGDHWSFAARTVDGSVEELKEDPPLGIQHFYCQLAAVNGTDIDDCRHLWPDCKCGCCCTIEVGNGKESHGDFNDLVQAIKTLPQDNRERLPIVICLLPGIHRLRETVVVASHFVTIRGCGNLAPVIGPDQGAAFELLGGHLHLEKIFLSARAPSDPAILCAGEATLLEGNEIETPGAPAVLSWDSEGLHLLGNKMRHVRRVREIPDDATGRLGVGDDIAVWTNVNLPGGGARETDVGLIVLDSGTTAARVIGNDLEPGWGHGIALAVASQRDLLIAANEIRDMLGSGIASVESQALPDRDDDVFISHVWTDESAATLNSSGRLAAATIPSPGRIDGLRIEHNTITGCVRGGLRVRNTGFPYGGIVLTRVDHVQISDNRIEGNGAKGRVDVPVAGLYVRNARGLIVRDNVIVGNGPKPDGRRLPGLQGGILGEDLSVILESIPVTAAGERAAVQPDGWPAAAVHGNLVVAPRGLALVLSGVGPMQVTDNRLTARDVLGGGDRAETPYDFHGAVAIVNLGVAAHLYRQFMAIGFLNQEAPKAPDGLETEFMVVGGKVEFSNNQVALDLARIESEAVLAAVGILTLDDLSFHDNQTECTLSMDFLFVDAFLIGTTVRATGNGFTESWFLAFISLWAAGFLMCTGTSNQGTHCIKVECMTPLLVDQHNLHLQCDDRWGSLRLFPK